MEKQNDFDGYKVYFDSRNIEHGKGRILWGTSTMTGRLQAFKEGWVLPGGRRTNDMETALKWAEWIKRQG